MGKLKDQEMMNQEIPGDGVLSEFEKELSLLSDDELEKKQRAYSAMRLLVAQMKPENAEIKSYQIDQEMGYTVRRVVLFVNEDTDLTLTLIRRSSNKY